MAKTVVDLIHCKLRDAKDAPTIWKAANLAGIISECLSSRGKCGLTLMRVVVVGSYARSLINFRGQLLQDMVNNGHEVIACAPQSPQHVVNALAEIGVSHEDIFLERTGTNPVSDLRALIGLKRLFARCRPDVVLLYTIKPVIYGSLAAKFGQVPNVFSMITGVGYVFGDSSLKQKFMRTMIQPMYWVALRNNTKVFFQNPDDQELFTSMNLVSGCEQCVLINGSGVDIEYYRETPPVTERIVFLLIARLISDKGINEYVEAARRIKQDYPEVVFRLVGPFDSNPSAIPKKKIEKWHDEGVIEYLGKTRDVRPYIAESSVYVLPSYREGTPRTVLEAMSMGRPIITSDAPGCRETVIESKNGYLVPVKDVDGLVQALERFILNPKLISMMGKESRKIAVKKYDVRKVNATILETMGLA